MTSNTGLSPKGPNQYVGPNVYLATSVTRNRAPTGADYRQPETGKLYPLDTYWLVGKNPTTGTYGDLWYLATIVANVANWRMLSTGGSGPTIGFVVPHGTSPVFPTVGGLITLTSTGSTITITGSTNTINLDTGGTVATLYTEDSGTAIPALGNLNIFGTNAANTIGSGNTVTINAINCAKWIVDPVAGVGTHTTIAGAIASASSGQTIFIRPGIYTENLTLKAGVNLTSFVADALTPNVTILGQCTFAVAGKVSISGIRLETNSNFILSVTGSSASIVSLSNCYLNCTNNTGINFTSSSSGAMINVKYCQGNLATTGIALFASSSVGTLYFQYTYISNTGISLTPNTISAGILFFNWSEILNPITSSGTGSANGFKSYIAGSGSQIAITCGSTGNDAWGSCTIFSGTASAVTIGGSSTLNLQNCILISTNATAIVGTGSVNLYNVTFPDNDIISNLLTINTAGGWYPPGDVGAAGSVMTSNGSKVCPTFKSVGTSGSFTPTLAFGGSSTGITYSMNTGAYTQIANIVFFSLIIELTSKGAQTGIATVGGFPVVNASPIQSQSMISASALTYDAGYTSIFFRQNAGTTGTFFEQGSAQTAIELTNASFSNTTNFVVSGSYFAS